MTNYYCADLHFGHSNVLSLDGRPFETIDECDNVIINNWNETVGLDDDVYILGDLSWYNSTKTIDIFDKLNGSLHLIRGNHDTKVLKNKKFRDMFVEITDYKEITFDDGKGLVLSHYPMLTFKNHYYGWWHFFGHVHNTWENDLVNNAIEQSIKMSGRPLNMVNVGIMMPIMEYRPKTFTEIVSAHKNKQY